MTQKLYFDVETAEIIDQDPLSQFATARIMAFSTGRSKHDTVCDEEALRKTAYTIYEKPIVFEYNNAFRDFGTHTKTPIISGFVVKDSARFVNQPDGRISLEVTAKIWKRYAQKFMDVFSDSETKKRSVSVEIEIISSEEDSNGFLKLIDWVYSAVCVLGELVTPASPGAEIEMLSFSEKENKEYQEAKDAEFSSKYDDIDFTIPSDVKKNAKQGLALIKEYGRGGTSVGLSTARYLTKNDVASPEKVRHMAKYFPRHANDNLDDKTSNGWIAWQLWGGNAGRKWSESLAKRMNEADEKQMSYFSQEKGRTMDTFSLTSAQITEILNSCLSNETYGENKYRKYWVETYDDECVYVYDNETGFIYCASYSLNQESLTAIIDMESKRRVVRGGYEVVDENGNVVFSDEMGTGNSLDVSESSEDLSESSWGSVDKTSLRKAVLKASNYKALVRKVYLLVEDGWEEHPSSSLKYPVMQLKDGKLVYNRYGLSAALQRAKGQEETSVVKKVLSLYKKLKIEQNEEDDLDMAEKEVTEEMAADETKETPKEESEEAPEEQEQEKEEGTEKEKFSLNAWADVASVLSFLEEETDDASEDAQNIRLAAEELKKDKSDFGIVFRGMYAKMCKMSAFAKACMAENEDLKKFKASVEEEKKQFAVDVTIKELCQKFSIPDEVVAEMKTSSKDFSYEKLNDWTNSVKARAVDFAVKTNENDGDQIITYAFPFGEAYKNPEELWN
jgi:hypothetical protein